MPPAAIYHRICRPHALCCSSGGRGRNQWPPDLFVNRFRPFFQYVHFMPLLQSPWAWMQPSTATALPSR